MRFRKPGVALPVSFVLITHRGYYKMTGGRTTSLNKVIVCCVMLRAFHLDLELEIMVFKLAAFANYY